MHPIKFKTLDQLNSMQIEQYQKTVQTAFPTITLNSEIVVKQWEKIEKYFPKHQIYAIDKQENIIGFANTIPFFWNQEAKDLPDDGWDWMVDKGISDFETKTKANTLGGLQIIVAQKYLGKGYSKIIIAEAKKLKQEQAYQNLYIPIRPTLKHQHAEMSMHDYINFKQDGKIYDPWIRTHLKSGANIISICHNSMNVRGNIKFWEKLNEAKIEKSGPLLIKGALNPVQIDLENNFGEYREPNIWIAY